MIKLRLLEAINYNYYKDKIPKEKFDELIKLDPSSGNKYSAWLVNKYLGNKETKNHIDNTKWYMIAQLLKDYDTYKSKNIIPAPYNDINQFGSTLYLRMYIEENRDYFEKQLQAKKDSKGKTAKAIYKDEKHLVVIPSTYEASRKYGTGTHWCTASASNYHYNEYMKDGTLYIHRFLFEDGSFREKAFQLYIPKEGAEDYQKVECNNASNNKVSSIEDTFLLGIPDEIADEFREKIEKAGGYNREFTIQGSMNAETEDGKIKIYMTYDLYDITDENFDPVGNEDIASMTIIQPIGKGITLPEEENELESALLDSDEFNFENGTGLLIHFYGDSPEEAQDIAGKEWGGKVGYWDRDVDDYEGEHELKQLKKYSFDYFVINREEEKGIDSTIDWLINPYVKEIKENNDVVSLNVGDEEYTVYFRTGYNYTTTGDWTSTPRQRKLDRQLDFPDMN